MKKRKKLRICLNVLLVVSLLFSTQTGSFSVLSEAGTARVISETLESSELLNSDEPLDSSEPLEDGEAILVDEEEPSVWFEDNWDVTDDDFTEEQVWIDDDSDSFPEFPEGTVEDFTEETADDVSDGIGDESEADSRDGEEIPDDEVPAAESVPEKSGLPIKEAESMAEEMVLFASEEAALYDLNGLPAFSGRTLNDLVSRYSAAVNAGRTYINGVESTYFESPSSDVSPYRQGRLTTDTLRAMQAMTDFYRWLTGSQALLNDSAQTVTLQKAALVRNFNYNRTVSGGRPSDMSSSLWKAGASLSVDLLAHHRSPIDSITAMMNCGYNRGGAYWYSMQNRSVLTDPKLSMVRFGYSGDVAVGVAKGYKNGGAAAFTAFPSPGWNAAELVSTTMSAWSVRIGTDEVRIPDESKLAVTVENLQSGASYICTKKNGKLQINDCGICFVEPPASGGSYAGASYRVTITGLADSVLSGEARITYTVRFANIFTQVTSGIRSYAFDYTKLMIGTDMASDSNLRKIAAVLPTSVIAIADTGAEFELPIRGNWTFDKANSCYQAKADTSSLPSGIADRRGVLKTVQMPYEIRDNNETRGSFLTFSRNPAVVGSPMQIGVSRWDISYNRSRIYRIRANGNGRYSGKLWLDSKTSKSFLKGTSGTYQHRFRLENVRTSDAGSYIAIYHYNQFRDAAYVCSRIMTLKMKAPSVSYRVYNRGAGWGSKKTNGAAAGCTRLFARIDAFRVKIKNNGNLGIRYTLARNGKNWSPTWRYDGDTAGRPKKGERIEAVKMKLTGKDASKYDLYYCVWVDGCGWLGWTKNGKPAGTRRRSKTIGAIRVKLVKKGAGAPRKCGRISRSFFYK